MQASKIMPKLTYAINYRGHLVGFQVMEVVTTRKDSTGSPHDYKSVVSGYVDAIDGGEREKITIPAAEVLGPFEEYVELVAKKKAEVEAKRAADKARENFIDGIVDDLYRACNVPVPPPDKLGRNPFARTYYSGIEIRGDGVQMLRDLLDRINATS